MNTIKKMTKRDITSLRDRLTRETREEMAREWEEPGAAEAFSAWKKEYDAETAMYAARKQANLTQAELAKRMNIPRANVSRIENGQNITIATFARYLRGCGFDFAFRIFPIADTAKV
ncbi:MAG: helix-turn-helix transcriptional regulator [Kiritimatiellae bacterium]|nr:helix-turn-helix transcriptional regulator [Kiritimatiellia bacterium]